MRNAPEGHARIGGIFTCRRHRACCSRSTWDSPATRTAIWSNVWARFGLRSEAVYQAYRRSRTTPSKR